MDVLSSMARGSTTPLPAMSAATCLAPCSHRAQMTIFSKFIDYKVLAEKQPC